MAISRIINTRFQLLNDTTANWELYGEKVLLRGEVGIELLENNKVKLKVGTGELAWKDLPYYGGETDLGDLEEVLKTLEAEIQVLVEKDTALENELTTLREVVGHSATADLAATGLFATLETKANKADVYTKEEVDNAYIAKEYFNEVAITNEYELVSLPKGTNVGWYDKEIRVMCPADTEWNFQPGNGGNANMYYMGFKAYAPEGAVSFKEDDLKTIEDQTMYYFEDNPFAGIDSYGRKYSIAWLALAQYNTTTETWNYFGKSSSAEKYIGWYYSVEWYDADGRMIHSDCIRINLSNEECHNIAQPYYIEQAVNKAVEEAKTYANGLMVEVVEF